MTIQISNTTRNGGIGVGTAIVFFANDPGTFYLLSASHVLAATVNAAVGDSIVAMTSNAAVQAGAVIGTLANWTGLIDGAGYPNIADAAIARLVANIVPEDVFPELVNLTFATALPLTGTLLTTISPSGAAGTVASNSGAAIITWQDNSGTIWDYGMSNQIVGAFSVRNGDSGAAVLNSDLAVVGLVSGVALATGGINTVNAVISPIAAIASHEQWGAGQTLLPYSARKAPPAVAAPPQAPAPAAPIPVAQAPAADAEPAPASATPAQQFIALHKADVLAVKAEYNIPASVCMAQSALETGWGKSVVGNPYFGIKSTSGEGATGEVVTYATHEAIGGRMVPCTASFRAYASFLEASLDYGRLLTTAPRYAPAMAERNSPEAFARAIAAAGYATDLDYADNLVAVLGSENLLSLDQ